MISRTLRRVEEFVVVPAQWDQALLPVGMCIPPASAPPVGCRNGGSTNKGLRGVGLRRVEDPASWSSLPDGTELGFPDMVVSLLFLFSFGGLLFVCVLDLGVLPYPKGRREMAGSAQNTTVGVT